MGKRGLPQSIESYQSNQSRSKFAWVASNQEALVHHRSTRSLTQPPCGSTAHHKVLSPLGKQVRSSQYLGSTIASGTQRPYSSPVPGRIRDVDSSHFRKCRRPSYNSHYMNGAALLQGKRGMYASEGRGEGFIHDRTRSTCTCEPNSDSQRISCHLSFPSSLRKECSDSPFSSLLSRLRRASAPRLQCTLGELPLDAVRPPPGRLIPGRGAAWFPHFPASVLSWVPGFHSSAALPLRRFFLSSISGDGRVRAITARQGHLAQQTSTRGAPDLQTLPVTILRWDKTEGR